MKLNSFHVSHGWLINFKPRHEIVSRRITNMVTRHDIENYNVVQKPKQDFLFQYCHLSSDYSPSEVVNTDQAGVEKKFIPPGHYPQLE